MVSFCSNIEDDGNLFGLLILFRPSVKDSVERRTENDHFCGLQTPTIPDPSNQLNLSNFEPRILISSFWKLSWSFLLLYRMKIGDVEGRHPEIGLLFGRQLWCGAHDIRVWAAVQRGAGGGSGLFAVSSLSVCPEVAQVAQRAPHLPPRIQGTARMSRGDASSTRNPNPAKIPST